MSPQINYQNGDPPPTEGALLSKIETALDNVLDDLGLESSQSSVKREKYIYLTIENFTEENQHPITLSWFKWGISTLAGPGGATSTETLFTELPEASGLFQANLEEIEDFLREDEHNLPLEDWWDEDFLVFLEYFYSQYGPDNYRELYLTNIRLLKLIDDIEGAIHFGRNPARKETYYEICEVTSDLKKHVLSRGELEGNYDYLRDFTQLLEDVVMMLVNLEDGDIKKGHQTAISELEGFYRDQVWLMIAHSISLESAQGPNVSSIYSWSSSNLEELRGGFNNSLETKKEICEAVDLLPEIGNYPDLENDNEEFEEVFDDFMAVVDGRRSHE